MEVAATMDLHQGSIRLSVGALVLLLELEEAEGDSKGLLPLLGLPMEDLSRVGDVEIHPPIPSEEGATKDVAQLPRGQEWDPKRRNQFSTTPFLL